MLRLKTLYLLPRQNYNLEVKQGQKTSIELFLFMMRNFVFLKMLKQNLHIK